MIEMLGLSSNLQGIHTRVRAQHAEMDLTYRGDINKMAPLGVQATKNFIVLWYCIDTKLITASVDPKEFRSLPSIIEIVFGWFFHSK